MPCALMDTLMFEHGVRNGQTVTSTEVQQQNNTRVQIREAVPPNHTPPGTTVIAHMRTEVSQQNKEVPIRGAFRAPLPRTPRRLGNWETTLSPTGKNPNIQAPSWGAMSKPTPAHHLSPWATSE